MRLRDSQHQHRRETIGLLLKPISPGTKTALPVSSPGPTLDIAWPRSRWIRRPHRKGRHAPDRCRRQRLRHLRRCASARSTPSAEVTVVVADAYPNFSICGIPYYISGEVEHWQNLAHRTLTDLQDTGMRPRLDTTATAIDPAGRRLHVTDAHGHEPGAGPTTD
jgi:hypothetical protein